MMRRVWYLTRPFVWRWRLGYWDWDAIKVCLLFGLRWSGPSWQGSRSND